jgi:methyltransferase (TIGR00027 family)
MLCQPQNRRSAPRMIAFQAIVLPAMLAPCVSALRAAEPGKPSRTAMLVLQMRALGAKLPDPDLRNPDTLAGRFFGTRERRVLAEVNDPIFADLDFDEAWGKMGHSRRLFLHVLARTRAIDDTVRESLRREATQVVMLGAGYDSRAYRMQGPLRGATVFEVDLPPMQELKKLRVREVLGRAPDNVVFVPIDLATEDLGPALRKAGYRRDCKTVFVWEGVSLYLADRDVDATLRFVVENSAPGSTIVFDYMSERVVRGDHDDELVKHRLAQVARWGEPWVFGLPIGEARAFVERRGLIVAADLGPQEITRQYLTRDDGTRLGDAAWYLAICVARVPEKGAQRP